METMIDLIDVTKSYGKGLPAVNHANLHVDKGEFVFVVRKRCICTACYRETNASDPQTCPGGSSGSGTC